MKLLFDNNLSVTVAEKLTPHFPGSKHIFELGLVDLSDRLIWEYAKENEFAVISKDKDFYHLANTLGAPPKLLWLLIGNCKNKDIIQFLIKESPEIKNFLRSSKGLLILTKKF